LKIIVIVILFLLTIDEENPKAHAEEKDHVEANVEEQEDHLGHAEEQLIRPSGPC